MCFVEDVEARAREFSIVSLFLFLRVYVFFFLVHLLRFVVSVALRFHLFLLAWSVLFSSFCYSEWLAGLGLAEV